MSYYVERYDNFRDFARIKGTPIDEPQTPFYTLDEAFQFMLRKDTNTLFKILEDKRTWRIIVYPNAVSVGIDEEDCNG